MKDQGMGGETLLEFAARQRLRCYRPRQVVLHQADCTDHVGIVLEGWAELVRQFPDGRRQILALALPGDIFACDPAPRARMEYAITALTPLTIAITGKAEFNRLLMTQSTLARSFWRTVSLALAIQRQWTANLGQMGALERVAHLMCETHLRLERAGLAAAGACAFPLTQCQIADACGLTQVHTNRVIQSLRRDGMIEFRNKRLTLLDRAALEAVARFDPGYLLPADPAPPTRTADIRDRGNPPAPAGVATA